MRRLVILRPEPGASATVESARAAGLDATAAPLFRIEPVTWEMPAGEFDALLLTSANAVRHGGPGLEALRELPVHAVGAATAEVARAAGFAVAASGEGGVDALLGAIAPGVRLLHLAGDDRRVPADARQPITAVTVYRAVELQADLDAIAGAVALVHSPRAARRLRELVPAEVRNTVRIAAISSAAADAAGAGWERVAAADAPNDADLLALAARLCDKQD